MKWISKEKKAHKHKISQESSEHPTPQCKVSNFRLVCTKAYWKKKSRKQPKGAIYVRVTHNHTLLEHIIPFPHDENIVLAYN